ncbi:hypothetical protein DB30_02108 [Enhygromyxa salina]|uniref:Uncharacterized protein n=1 Tax=Enhygromyxa salina TaxID=215803 RepID=A0A0C1ZM72_9BACT|nr:hypothetical protein [Enhygromyxa salina]KIG12023.1 hypothetical protein DB30_02108 [Enhygromyxa salina]
MLQTIINFFRKLFGLDSDTGSGSGNMKQLSQGELREKHIKGLEHIEGAENIRVSTGDVIRRVEGAALIRDEDDGEMLWTSEINLEVTPQQFQDDFGPLAGPDDLGKFLFHETEINMVMQGDADEAERKCQEFGYAHMGQFFRVRGTMLKHKGTAGGPQLDDFVFDSGDVMRAAMDGAHMRQAYTSQGALAADPELLAPVDGVDLDTYAKLAATSATGLPQDQFTAMLAQHGLDAAKWQSVNAVWTDRMAKDTSHTITTAYGKAFGAAGAGQYGAAGAAGAAVMGTTNAAGGEAPVSFERYCEIAGAQAAWAESGQDVNAMMKQVFNMNALDWSTMSMWWMQKLQSDPSLFQPHTDLCEKYKTQYGAGGMAGADDDLSF